MKADPREVFYLPGDNERPVRAITSIVAACCLAALYGCGASSMSPALPTQTNAALHRAGSPAFDTLYAFTDRINGAGPTGAVVRFQGKLFGATGGGGSSRVTCDCGVVYSLDSSGNEHVVHAFLGINYRNHTADGQYPKGGLIEYKGRLYGTTSSGGVTNSSLDCAFQTSYGCGTVYSIDAQGRERVVYSFQGTGNGYAPVGELVPFDGKLYGVTAQGGNCENCGIVYSVTPSGTETVVHRFSGNDGILPEAGLTVVNGKLYGTAEQGGSCCGTVFTIDDKNRFALIYSFTDEDEGFPDSTLVQIGSTLYGTVYGNANCGGIFSLANKNVEKTVHTFCASQTDGSVPGGGGTAVDNVLYGTTILGGAGCRFGRGCGTIFAFDPSTKQEAPAHVFLSSEGSEPNGLVAINGTLFGALPRGGAPGKQRGYGTLYSFKP